MLALYILTVEKEYLQVFVQNADICSPLLLSPWQELHEFLKDLTDWEQTVKIKEKKLASGTTKDSVCASLYQSLFNKYSIGLYLG